VPFIHVADGGVQIHGPQRTNAPDAEQHLLLDAHLDVAPVQAVADVSVGGRIGLDVGVEEKERDASHVEAPHLRAHLAPIHGDLHGKRLAVLVGHEGQRLAGWIDVLGLLGLPAVGCEHLLKVAFVVEEADAHEREAEVAGRLQVVACQHPQSAGVVGERLGQSELHREVGDDVAGAGAGHMDVGRPVEVFREVLGDAVELVEEALLGREVIEGGGGRDLKEAHGVSPCLLPGRAVDAREELGRVRLPGPVEVPGKLAEWF
jgi:hypothetical protein